MPEIVKEILTSLIMAGLSILLGNAVLYVNKVKRMVEAETNKISNEHEQEIFQLALKHVDALALVTVKAYEQTMAKDLRVDVKNGLAKEKTLSNLAMKAANEIYSNIKPEYLMALESGMSDVSAYIMNLIESKVLEIKKETGEVMLVMPNGVKHDDDDP